MPIRCRPSGIFRQTRGVHTDPLGTPLAVTNTPANPSVTPAVVVWRASYEPFGKATVNQDPDGDGTTLK